MSFIGAYHEAKKHIKLDILDRKILYLLGKNGRYAESSMAKALKTSKEVIHYRLKRLQEEDFLNGVLTMLDPKKLGQTLFSVNLSLHPFPDDQGLLASLVAEPRVNVVRQYNSQQYVQFTFAAVSVEEFVAFFDGLQNAYHSLIKDYNISTILEEHFFGYDFILEGDDQPRVVEKKGSSFQKEFAGKEGKGKRGKQSKAQQGGQNQVLLDAKDKEILQQLQLQGRIALLQVAKNIGLSPSSVHKRLSDLISWGVIRHFLLYAQFSYVGYQWYILQLRTKNLDQAVFLEYLRRSKNAVWLTKRIGKWNYHISVFAKDNTEFVQFVQGIRNNFHQSLIDFDSGVLFRQYKYAQRVA